MDSGDTAWMLMATALVMIMLPGLALFYGGLVRRKNVLSTVMHSFFGLALVSIVWVIVGFTLAFGSDVGGYGLIGGLEYAMFNGVGLEPSTVYATTIPFVLFASFQLMFAAITPALITGAFAERKRFAAFVMFTILWSIFVYSPIAHWVWSVDGWLYKLGALDFAGGTVVHLSSGISALVVALLIGKRHLNGDPTEPHDIPMVVLGRGSAVVRLVRLQRRLRPDGGRPRRERLHRHEHRRRRRDRHLGPGELRPAPQGQCRRRRLRGRRGARRDHSGVGLRHRRRRPDHRPRGRWPVLQRDAAAGLHQGRRCPRRVRRPRCRRDVRCDRDRHLRLVDDPGRVLRPARRATSSSSSIR